VTISKDSANKKDTSGTAKQDGDKLLRKTGLDIQNGTLASNSRDSSTLTKKHASADTETRTESSAVLAQTTYSTVGSSVSWLISFPNSGTTYTIHNTEHISMRSTATNYMSEVHFARTELVPVRPDSDNVAHGPWQRNNSLAMPRVALTKTHCTGYDDRAPLQSSIISTRRFLEGCAQSSQYADLDNLKNKTKVKSGYDHTGLVVRVIHLVRNPFDNIISRMHHGMRIRRKEFGLTEEQSREFMSSPTGVMAWCRIADRAFWMAREVPKKIKNKHKLRRKPWNLNLLLKVPCHSELFRYVEWHNAAIRMIEEEQLPSLVVYYEDYNTNYNQTVDSILDFLDLTREAEPLPFSSGKTYRDLYFSPEIQETTKELLKVMASKELWQILQRYFPSTASVVE
jgi:hypothetical protein